MPPPTNITFLTATDIGTLTGYTPYTIAEDAWNGSSADPLYFSYLPVAGDDMLEVYGYGNGTTNLPNLKIYSGPASAPVQLANNNTSTSRPVQQDIVTFVASGQRVFFEFVSANVNPAVLTVRIARGQKELIINNDLYINDSTSGFPGIVLTQGGAIPKRYSLNYPASEGQQVLRNGVVGVLDAFTLNGLVLYDVASTGFTMRNTPTMPDTHYTEALSTNQVDTFWAFRRFGGGNSFAVSVDQDGVVGTPLNLGFTAISEGVPQADNSALYCIRSTEIKKITNPGGVGSTFLTVDATFSFGNNLLMLTDDTLLVPYTKTSTLPYVKQFNLSAGLLTTISLTSVGTVNTLERIFHDPFDTQFFWIWYQSSVLNHFEKIQISDGSVITSLSRTKFNSGVSQTTTLVADTTYSGNDFSCVPIILRLVEVIAKSGLYKLTGTNIANPRINHDVNWIDAQLGTSEEVNIPDPFAESYLAGDE